MMMIATSFLRKRWRDLTLGKLLRYFAVFSLLNVIYKLWWRVRKMRRFFRNTKHLPGPTGKVDWLAKGLLRNRHRIHDWQLDEYMKTKIAHEAKGRTDPLALVRRPVPDAFLHAASPEAVKFILKDRFDSFTKPAPNEDALFELMRTFLGDGIFSIQHGVASKEEDALWYMQRKQASKIFTKNNFNKMMYETFVEKGYKLVDRLKSRDGERLDMQDFFFRFTFDSIEKIFFGLESDSMGETQNKYAQAFDDCHRSMVKYLLHHIPLDFLTRFVIPFPFGRLTPQTPGCILTTLDRWTNPDYQEFIRSVKKLDEITFERVHAMRNDPNMMERTDLISNFFKMDQTLTDRQLRDLVLNFIIAGRDTSACLLTWIFYELAMNPHVQMKLQEEVDRVHGKNPPSEYESVSAETMPYLTGVVMEGLRLHPPVPVNIKIASQDVVFPDGTVIPEGTRVSYGPYVLGRSEYENPMKFDPSRWIPFKEPNMYEFPAFQAGPRFCLGQQMAKFEVKLLTCILMQNFTFTIDPADTEVTYGLMLTMNLNQPDRKTANLWLTPHVRP